MMTEAENNVLIGSYTNGEEKASVYIYNPIEKNAKAILSAINPSYIICHQGYIYIACEHEKGQLLTLNEQFKLLSRMSTLGSNPCHLAIDSEGRFIVVTNYDSGSVAIFQLQNHQPTKIRCFITHEGSGTHPDRQTGPHPHSTIFSEDGKLLFVADLGTDTIYIYNLQGQNILVEKEKSIKMPKSGPRTLAHGKLGSKKIYVSCELDNTIRVLSYQKGYLELIVAYMVSKNPENFPSQVCYFDGKIYLTTRGDDMFYIFDEQGDKLEQKLAFKVGLCPRHFLVTHYQVIYVGCQGQNKVYRYMMKDGKVFQIGELAIDSPSVITLIK